MHIPSMPGVNVTVCIDGRPLREYPTDTSDTDDLPETTCSSYIEASAGAAFSVDLTTTRAYPHRKNDMNFQAFLEGQYADGLFLSHRQLRHGTAQSLKGIAIGGTFRAFHFADIKTTDEQARISMKDTLAKLGELTVTLYRCRESQRRPTDRPPGYSVFESKAADGVPEKALKGRAISCRASLGEAEKVPQVQPVHTDYPWGKQAIATYRFLYRSRRDLQIENIISRSPTPVPLEDRDVDTLSVEEARELARRLKARQTATNVKSEFVKREKKRSHAVVDISSGEEDDDSGADAEVTVVSVNDRRKRVKVEGNVDVVDLS